MKNRILLSLLIISLSAITAVAQRIAVKTNVLYDITATVNVGAEMPVAPQWTIDVSADINTWSVHNLRTWKHWFIQPEARYWLCEQFSGSFVAVHGIGGQYNMGHLHNGIKILGADFSRLSDGHYQGWFVGAGIAYGYALPIGRHWNLEGEIGLGVIHAKYDRLQCHTGQNAENNRHSTFIAPTKAAINIVYLF